MIRHIVMWRVRGESISEREKNVEKLVRSFESLRGHVPGLISLELGVDVSKVDYACDVVLVTEFDSQNSLDSYATHPEHLRVKTELTDIRIARHQVDYVV